MAQLPPRAPTMAPNWPPAFPPHQTMLPLTAPATLQPPAATSPTQPPSWGDEFLDFTSTRRSTHRRSMSDSIAFLEAPLMPNSLLHGAAAGFDGLDDDQLMSMFSDDLAASASAVPSLGSPPSHSSSPSDQTSNNDDKQISVEHPAPPATTKVEHGEVESPCDPNDDSAPPHPNPSSDSIIDPKRVKRILANRQSAQRSRVRKLQYISELERSVTTLQTEVSALSPRVAYLDHQRLILSVDNSALKQRIAALAQDKIFKDAHQEALKKEIERLRQIYHQQNMKKLSNNNNSTGAATDQSADNTPFVDQKKQLMAS